MIPHIQNCQRKLRVQIPPLEKFTNQLCYLLRHPSVEFTVRLSNDRRIRELNRMFRKKDKATDVLSFSAEALEGGTDPGEAPYLGDVIISLETAQRQAHQRGHELEKEIEILILHGFLHLLGYDHETDQGQMRRKELRIQKKLLKGNSKL